MRTTASTSTPFHFIKFRIFVHVTIILFHVFSCDSLERSILHTSQKERNLHFSRLSHTMFWANSWNDAQLLCGKYKIPDLLSSVLPRASTMAASWSVYVIFEHSTLKRSLKKRPSLEQVRTTNWEAGCNYRANLSSALPKRVALRLAETGCLLGRLVVPEAWEI